MVVIKKNFPSSDLKGLQPGHMSGTGASAMVPGLVSGSIPGPFCRAGLCREPLESFTCGAPASCLPNLLSEEANRGGHAYSYRHAARPCTPIAGIHTCTWSYASVTCTESRQKSLQTYRGCWSGEVRGQAFSAVGDSQPTGIRRDRGEKRHQAFSGCPAMAFLLHFSP